MKGGGNKEELCCKSVKRHAGRRLDIQVVVHHQLLQPEACTRALPTCTCVFLTSSDPIDSVPRHDQIRSIDRARHVLTRTSESLCNSSAPQRRSHEGIITRPPHPLLHIPPVNLSVEPRQYIPAQKYHSIIRTAHLTVGNVRRGRKQPSRAFHEGGRASAAGAAVVVAVVPLGEPGLVRPKERLRRVENVVGRFRGETVQLRRRW